MATQKPRIVAFRRDLVFEPWVPAAGAPVMTDFAPSSVDSAPRTEPTTRRTHAAARRRGADASRARADRAPRQCCCGALLPSAIARHAGRPRVTCSIACRRRRDALTRQMRRRQLWIEQWQAHRRLGVYTAAQIVCERRELRGEIRALSQAAGRD